MAKVIVQPNESIEDAIKRFKRQVSMDGVLNACKYREYYRNPTEKRKFKQETKNKNKKRK